MACAQLGRTATPPPRRCSGLLSHDRLNFYFTMGLGSTKSENCTSTKNSCTCVKRMCRISHCLHNLDPRHRISSKSSGTTHRQSAPLIQCIPGSTCPHRQSRRKTLPVQEQHMSEDAIDRHHRIELLKDINFTLSNRRHSLHILLLEITRRNVVHFTTTSPRDSPPGQTQPCGCKPTVPTERSPPVGRRPKGLPPGCCLLSCNKQLTHSGPRGWETEAPTGWQHDTAESRTQWTPVGPSPVRAPVLTLHPCAIRKLRKYTTIKTNKLFSTEPKQIVRSSARDTTLVHIVLTRAYCLVKRLYSSNLQASGLTCHSVHSELQENSENSSVSSVLKYCPTSTVVRNPASVQNVLTLSCSHNFSTRSLSSQ